MTHRAASSLAPQPKRAAFSDTTPAPIRISPYGKVMTSVGAGSLKNSPCTLAIARLLSMVASISSSRPNAELVDRTAARQAGRALSAMSLMNAKSNTTFRCLFLITQKCATKSEYHLAARKLGHWQPVGLGIDEPDYAADFCSLRMVVAEDSFSSRFAGYAIRACSMLMSVNRKLSAIFRISARVRGASSS